MSYSTTKMLSANGRIVTVCRIKQHIKNNFLIKNDRLVFAYLLSCHSCCMQLVQGFNFMKK